MRISSTSGKLSLTAACIAVAWFLAIGACRAQFIDASPEAKANADKTPPEDEKVLPAPKLSAPVGAKKLPKPDEVWVDAKKKQVYVDGYVSLREGYLEMFACLVGTKEHESVVAVRTKAQTVHAALLAIGAKSGTPVEWQPKFKAPTGTEIEVEVRWLDDKGQWKAARAQDWIRNAETKKLMTYPFVFAGSGFWKEPETDKEYYMAESGDFICVSNFATAMLDVPIESSQSNEALSFAANTDKIPALGTPVRLVLTPKLKDGEKGPAK
jgi:hypothetical protein